MCTEKAFCCRSRHTPALWAIPIEVGLHPGPLGHSYREGITPRPLRGHRHYLSKGEFQESVLGIEHQALSVLYKSPLERGASFIV